MKPVIKMLENRKHYVVPAVLLVEGVLNGSQGPLYYPSDEIRSAVSLWNGRPVVIYHPTLNGMAISAADPEVVNRQKIGTVFNARMEGNRLLADLWIDVERAEIDHRVAITLRSGQRMGVSTGLWTENERKQGVFNDRVYRAVARKHQPDHLAVLPSGTGACSLSMGCGLAV